MEIDSLSPLSKLQTTWDTPIQYRLNTQNKTIPLNTYLSKDIQIRYEGKIICIRCGRETKKSFFQGYCYPCFKRSPETAECIIHPERCRAHLGEGKDPSWEKKHHNQEHIVYLARSSAIKVGVTRADQLPTRWIDQGATEGLIFAQTPNRYTAGVLEVALKQHITDKTAWQAMLKNTHCDASLADKKDALTQHIPSKMHHFITTDNKGITMSYPVISYPEKIKALNLDKTPFYEGRLLGIKGQYLLLEGGIVFNVRRHSGYLCRVCV